MKKYAWMRFEQGIYLDKAGVKIWAYGKRNKFLGRIEVNGAGLAAFSGLKGQRRLGNLSWESLFEILENRKRR